MDIDSHPPAGESNPSVPQPSAESSSLKGETSTEVIDMDTPSQSVKRQRSDDVPMEQPANGAKQAIRFPKSFAIQVESISKASSNDATGAAPKVLGESPEMLKTFCKHEVSLPPDLEEGYDFACFSNVSTDRETLKDKPAKEYKFSLDAFQRESIKCLEKRESVLVAAHTSAGKTVVAEYAIAMSLRDKQRVIYTSPIKALSNQKYRELDAEFQDVGLMTGDVTINKNASCLVMTTEILRSMLYRGSEVVREVAWVIFDEVHYMRDKERGVVWEETIILVPQNVRFVFLSATIPNAREFSEWVAHLKNQPCHTILTDTRPVPLQHYMFPAGGEGLHLVVDDKGEFRADSFERVIAELGSKAGDGSGSASGAGQKKRGFRPGQSAPGKSDCYKVVKMIMERNFYPVIVFSFSRRECENMAMQMAKLQFNDEGEQQLVQQVYENAIMSLNDEDQDLPQITAVLPLLKYGIGIHHSGLLPIVKEVVELLFQEGLIKALFATETFSMGLNMPARTVLFTSVRKFDGEKFRYVLGGEYVQMSGRAGRRGIDERGIAILMCDEKIEPSAAKSIMSGSAEPLRSTFHLGYNMLLNLMRAEEADPEYVIARSLAQFQADKHLPENEEKLAKLEAKKNSLVVGGEDTGADEADVRGYFRLRDHAEHYRHEIREMVHQPKYILPFLQSGRLVRVRDAAKGYDYGWGAVVSWKKRASKVNQEERFTASVLLRCQASIAGEQKPKPFKQSKVSIWDDVEGEGHATDANSSEKEDGKIKEEWKIVPCSLKDLDGLSAIRVYKPDDLKPTENRSAVGKSVVEVLRRFPDGPPMLDPFKDLGIKEEGLALHMRRLEAVEEAMSASKVEKSPYMRKLLRQWQKKKRVMEEIKGVKRELKIAQGLILKEELKKMKRVLRRLDFVNSDGVVEVKGRVACEVNTADELVITELLLGGSLNDMTPEVVVALISCFVLDEGKKIPDLKLEKELEPALECLQAVATRVASVTKECGIPIDESLFVDSFSPNAMSVVYNWCKGKSFADVCALSDLFEGSVIRCLRRLEELLRQLIAAVKCIGNAELESKFEEGSAKLKRGIPFQSSLYT